MLIRFYFVNDVICDKFLIFGYIITKFNRLDREIKKVGCIVYSNCDDSCRWGVTEFRGYPNEEWLCLHETELPIHNECSLTVRAASNFPSLSAMVLSRRARYTEGFVWNL